MSETQTDVMLAVLADFVFEMYAKQSAMPSLLRDTPGYSPGILDRELEKAIRQLHRLPGVRELRTKRDLTKLMEIMATLRTM